MTQVLVTCGGGFQGLGVLRALQAAGAETYACDTYPDNPARYVAHHYLVCPPSSENTAYEAFLLQTTAREKIECIFPATALDLRLLSHLRATLLIQGTTVAVCAQPLLDQLLDKRKTLGFLAASDLPVQQIMDPLQHDFAYPLLGKPLGGWGSRGIETLATRHDLKRLVQSVEPGAYVWTRRLDRFDEYSADFAIGAEQAISPITIRRRARTSGGFAIVSESIDDVELTPLFARTAQALARAGGFGLFNVQIICPTGGTVPAFISDVNPRVGTSATHALGEGNNLPAWFMASACLGTRTTRQSSPRQMIKNVRLLSDVPVPVLPKRPRGVVFDLDDTLVDHRRWLLAKMRILYDLCFRSRVAAPDFLSVVIQLIEDHEWAYLIDRTLELLGLPETFREEAIAAYRSAEVPETPTFDDVEPVLADLRHAGIKVAILTDNPPATQRSKIIHSDALRAVDASIFSREHGKEKPATTAFLQTARALALPPDALVMVGDNWMRDCEGALRSGYAHAFAIRREGFGDASLAQSMSSNRGRISVVPGLVPVVRACLDAPA